MCRWWLTCLLLQVFPPVKWYFVLVIEIIAPAFAVCNAYGAGLTDWNVASTYAKLCIFAFAAWAGKDVSPFYYHHLFFNIVVSIIFCIVVVGIFFVVVVIVLWT